MNFREELCWLAGILEGEGSFGCYPKGKGGQPRIWIGMCDRDTIDKVGRIAGATAGVFTRTPYVGAKDSHVLSITGRRAAGLMMMIYPFMSVRRKESIRLTLEEWKLRPSRAQVSPMCGHAGRKTKARRMCSSCYTMWNQGRLRFDLHPEISIQ